MGGLVELFQQPVVAAVATALVILGFLLAFIFLGRSSRERRAREEAQHREHNLRRQFEAILGNARDGVVVSSTSGEVQLITEAAAGLLGVDKTDAVGRPVARLPLKAVDERMQPVMPAEVHNAAPAAVRQPVNRAFTLRATRAHAADGPSAKRRTDASDTRRDRPIFTESSCSA